MLRSAFVAAVALVTVACSAGIAPPTAPPTGGSTLAPTSAPSATPTAVPTSATTPAASPTNAPTSGPAGEVCGSDWLTSAGECDGAIGDRFVFQCPPGGRAQPVYGTDTYTDDSTVCVAAVHAGLINFDAGGTVTIQISPGLSAYVGSSRYGVDSNSWTSWPTSFVFVGGVAPTPSSGPSAAPGTGYGANMLLFSDDFSDTSGGWDTATDLNGSVAYDSEMLVIDLAADVSYLTTSDPVSTTPSNVVRIEATVTATGGNGTNYAGLLCGSSAEDAAGAVLGTDGVYAFIQRSGTTYAALRIETGVPLLQNGLPAQLTLECAGTNTGSLRLRIWFNGAPFAEYVGDAGPASFQTASAYVEGKTGAHFTLDDVTVYGGDGTSLPPLPTAAPSPVSTGASSGDPALLAHVPPAMNVGCHEVTTFSAGEIAAISCTPSTITGYVTYTLFDTEDNATAKWFGDYDYFAPGVSGSDCSSGPCLVAWERGGISEGRYFANNYTGIDPTGLIAYWFDTGLRIEAGLAVYETTFAELYNLALQAGPTP